MIRKASCTVFFGLTACLFALAGVAWACTPQQQISILPRSGPAGSSVAVNGIGFGSPLVTGPGPIEVHWNSVDGALLATTLQSDFALAFQAPVGAQAGVYYVVVIRRDAAGSIVGKVAETFEITGSSGNGSATARSRALSDSLWNGFGSSGSSATLGASASLANSSTQAVRTHLGLAASGATAVLAGAGGLLIYVRRKRALTNGHT